MLGTQIADVVAKRRGDDETDLLGQHETLSPSTLRPRLSRCASARAFIPDAMFLDKSSVGLYGLTILTSPLFSAMPTNHSRQVLFKLGRQIDIEFFRLTQQVSIDAQDRGGLETPFTAVSRQTGCAHGMRMPNTSQAHVGNTG